MRSFIFLAALLIVPSLCFAQESTPSPMEWGKVDPKDVGITSFPGDTAATAVVLCEYGESSMNNDMNVEFFQHVRIRLLSPAAYDPWGTHSVVIDEEDRNGESIDDIEGATYTRNADGSVATHEMSSDAVFKEGLRGSLTRYKFTLPALAPGCVIEYRYRIVARNWHMRSWWFQSSEPVLWSEYRVAAPVQIAYATVTQGYESFVVHEETMEARIASGELASYLRRNGGEFRVYRWAVANAPAIRSEAFITTTKDYRDRVDIQLTGYALSGGGSRNVLSDWGKLVDQLAESPSFAGKIDATSAVRILAASLTAGCASSEDTVRALYNWVDTALVHNDEGLTMSGDVDDVLGSKRASSLESTVLFLSLLKAVGKTGDLVLYSSRTHGEIQKLQPLISQFDEVLARVAVGPRTMDLSPTDPLRPMDLLPVEALNREGLVIRANTLLWVPMTSDRRSVRNVLASVWIHEDGTSEGWLEGESSDYAAVRFRRWAEARKDHARALEFFGLEEREATVDSIIIEHLPDMSVPVRVRAHATGFSGITKIGDRIYVTPMLADRVKENPLTLEKRKFPVDFAYPWLQMVTVKLELPTGFVLSDTLPNRSHSAVNGTGIYTRRLRIDSACVEMASRFEVLKSKFDPRSYAELREFYGAVVGAQGEQFAIEKRVIPSPPPERTKPEERAKRVKR